MSVSTPILSTAPTSAGNCVYETHCKVHVSPAVPLQPLPSLCQTAATAATTFCSGSGEQQAPGLFFSTEEIRVPLGHQGEDVLISVPRYAAETLSKRAGTARAPPGLENLIKTQSNSKTIVRPLGVHLPLLPPPGLSDHLRGSPGTPVECLDAPSTATKTPSVMMSTYTEQGKMQQKLNEVVASAGKASQRHTAEDIQSAMTPLPSLLNSVPRYIQTSDGKIKMTKPVEVLCETTSLLMEQTQLLIQ